jgi:ribosomal protein S27AE
MRRAELRRRARAATGELMQSDVMCLACGWQAVMVYRHPRERWTCPECHARELVRDDDEAERPARAEIEEGEA